MSKRISCLPSAINAYIHTHTDILLSLRKNIFIWFHLKRADTEIELTNGGAELICLQLCTSFFYVKLNLQMSLQNDIDAREDDNT